MLDALLFAALSQNGGCNECKVGCYLYSQNPLFSMIFTFFYTVSLIRVIMRTAYTGVLYYILRGGPEVFRSSGGQEPQDLQRYVKDLFLSVYGTAPAEEKAGAVGLIKRGFSYGTE